MGELRLRLLGRPQIMFDDTALTCWSLQKSLALLAYLAVTGRTHSRGALVGLLWPECTETNARSNLRKVVAELHRRLPEHMTIGRVEVGFDRASTYWLDVEAFEQGITGGLASPDKRLTRRGAGALAAAIELYGEDFMEGLAIRGAPAFEEWLLLEREHLRNLALRALHALADHHAAAGQHTQTLACLDRLLELEPAHEEAHRHRMRLLAHLDQRAAALRQYEACRKAMRALDTEPDEETMALYERIRSGATVLVPGEATAATGGQFLSMPLNPLIGREAEVAEVQALLRDPSCRLLTVVGPGGVGKTHLALQATGGMRPTDPLDCFEDGVCFVSLGSLPAVEAIVPAVAQALDLRLPEGVHPERQVAEYLCRRQLLLVMDGFEHLLASAGLLVDLLQAAPGLKILVTSRARLDVMAEHQYPLYGLATTGRVADGSESLESIPAVHLYLSRARRIWPGFEPSAADLADIVRICRLVHGLPLAILLAASWTGMLTPSQIASEFEAKSGRGLDLLQTDGPDLPARQRSMRAVFDHSWALLAARERQALAGLSVFRGSLRLEAARQVARASLVELRVLTDRSLLQRVAAGRYAMHELLRQYAQERFAERPEAAGTARDRHSAYFAACAARWWLDLQGPGQQVALAEMAAEYGNLRAAWDWAVQRGQVAELERAMEGLCYYHKWLGRYREGESLCRQAVKGLSAGGALLRERDADQPRGRAPRASLERSRVRALALAWQGVFCHRLGQVEQAWKLLRRSREWLDNLAWRGPSVCDRPPEEVQRARAFVSWRLGNLAFEVDRGAAQRLYRQSLALYRSLEDSWGTGCVLEALGRTGTFSQDGDLARHAYEESLELRQAQGDNWASYRVVALNLATQAYHSQPDEEPCALQVPSEAALHEVGLAIGAGQFVKAETLLEQEVSGGEFPGCESRTDVVEMIRAFNKMHLGQYETARALTLACLARFRETGYRWGMERCCCYLGLAALAVGSYEEARRWVEESAGLCRETKQKGHLGQAFALLALTLRGTGDLQQAREHLREALRVAEHIYDYETFMFQTIIVCAMAVVLADEGEHERAVELYAMASRYALVANSRLVEDLAGRHIAAVAARMPVAASNAARERGAAGDLDTAMAHILAELGEQLNSRASTHVAWDRRVHLAEGKRDAGALELRDPGSGLGCSIGTPGATRTPAHGSGGRRSIH